MSLATRCNCTLCRVEIHLFSELALAAPKTNEIFSSLPTLATHSSLANLVSHLRCLKADARSDEILRALVLLLPDHAAPVQSILVLAFLPLLHHTVRLVTLQQSAVPPEDSAQEALSFLIEFIHSAEMRDRRSHFAYAVSRELKRHVFTWARRESRNTAVLDHLDGQIPAALILHSSFERLTQLRHLLYRAVTTGRLTEAELNLLVDFKLNGGTVVEPGGLNGTASNAVRQKLKRLLAKLRKLSS